MKNIIFVRNLELSGTHGQGKRPLKKVFTISIEVYLYSIGNAVKNDSLEKTFDYRRAVAIAREVIEGPSVHLIETIASRITDKILVFPGVEKIKLTLMKCELGDTFDSGITLERESRLFQQESNVR